MNAAALLEGAVVLSAALSAACIAGGAALAARAPRRPAFPGRLPPVSAIKPVRGVDPGARENFLACFDQDYPAAVQWIVAVESASDPAAALVRALQAERPSLDLTLVVAGLSESGSQKLHNMKAARALARHPVLCVSDSDVRPGPGALRRLVSELEATGAGAVCASVFYTDAGNLAGRAFQAFANADIAGILAVQEALGRPDVLVGGMHVLRAETLAAVGGYESLGDHISDDGALGMRLARHGFSVLASGEAVSMIHPRPRWSEFAATAHRWWLMMRVSAPRRFAMSLLLFGPFYGMTWWGLAILSGSAPPAAWLCGPGLAALHVATAAWVGRVRGPRGLGLGYSWLRPAVDWACFFLWWAAWLHPRIQWRGHKYVVTADGTARRAGAS